MNSAWVDYPDGRSRPVKNLGYLLKHWKQVSFFIVSDVHQDDFEAKINIRANDQCYLLAYFQDGRIYRVSWGSARQCWHWLHRPTIYDVRMVWFGTRCRITKGNKNFKSVFLPVPQWWEFTDDERQRFRWEINRYTVDS